MANKPTNTPNIECWGKMFDDHFVKPASDKIVEALIGTSLSMDELQDLWTNKLGLGNLEFDSRLAGYFLVKCSERDIIRLGGAIRYEEAPGVTSAGKNRKVRLA